MGNSLQAEFAELLAERETKDRAAFDTSVLAAAALAPQPDVADLVSETGFSQSFIEEHGTPLKAQRRLEGFPTDDVFRSPSLRRFYSEPGRATVGLEDAPRLLSLERSIRGEQDPERVPGLAEVLGNRSDVGFSLAFDSPSATLPIIESALGGRQATEEQRRAHDAILRRQFGPLERPGVLDDVFGPFFQNVPILISTILAGGSGGLAGAGTGAVIGGGLGLAGFGVGAVPGAVAGASTGFFFGSRAGGALQIAAVEASAFFNETDGLTDQAGNPIPEEVRAGASLVVSAINTGLEGFGFLTIIKVFPGVAALLDKGVGAKAATRAFFKRQMLDPARRSFLIQAGKQVARAMGIEVATEIVQETTNIEVARVISGEGVGLDAEDLERLAQTGLETALAVIPIVGPSASLSTAISRSQQARDNHVRMEAAQRAAQAAKQGNLTPLLFLDLTEDMAAEAGLERVFMPAKELVARYEEAGLGLPEIEADLPGISDRLTEALRRGEDVELSLGQVLGTLDDRFGNAILPDIRLFEGDLTLRESAVSDEALPELIRREAEFQTTDHEGDVAPVQQWRVTVIERDENQEHTGQRRTEVFDTREEARAFADAANAGNDLATDPAPVVSESGPLSGAERRAPTEAELAVHEGEIELNLGPVFHVKPEGMSEERFERMQDSWRAAEADALVKAEAAGARAEARRQGEEFTARTAELRETVGAEVVQRRDVQARHWLETGHALQGEMPDGFEHAKLDQARVAEMLPGVVLPPEVLQVDGLSPEYAAELFGYDSTAAFLTDLAASSDLETTIETEVTEQLESEFGADFAVDVGVEAYQHEPLMRALLIEERALADMRGLKPASREQLRLEAQRVVRERQGRNLQPHRHRRSAAQASRLSAEAWGAGNVAEAQRQKQLQILHTMLEQETRAARDDGEKRTRHVVKSDQLAGRKRIGKAGPGYLEAWDGLLERFNFRGAQPTPLPGRTPRVLRGRVSDRKALMAFVEEQRQLGEEILIPESMQDERFQADVRDLTYGEFVELTDTLFHLEHIARRKTTIKEGRARKEARTVAQDVVARIGRAFPNGRHVILNPGAIEKGKAFARQVDSSLARVEWVIDALMANDPDSPLRKMWDRLVDAQTRYNAMGADYSGRLQKLIDDLLGEEKLRRYAAPIAEDRLLHRQLDSEGRAVGPAVPFSDLNRRNVLVMAMNMGNVSNRSKFIRGWGMDQIHGSEEAATEVIRAVMNTHLDASDIVFVQAVLDETQTLWPEISTLERRVNGVEPERIDPSGFQTQHGTIRGGYFPVAYDNRVSNAPVRLQDAFLVPGASEGYTRATTGHGFTEKRISEFARPIRMDLEVISHHLDQVILDLTHREAIQDFSRFVARPDVNAAVTSAMGPEFGHNNFWEPWLKAIARDTMDPGPIAIWNRIARSARTHATIFTLGFSHTTLIMQAIGHSNAQGVMRQAFKANGVSTRFKFYQSRGIIRALGRGNPARAWRTFSEVAEKSAFMRDRVGINSLNRDMRDVIRDAERTNSVTKQVGAFALRLIGQVQFITVDLPVWLAAHQAGTDAMNMTDEQAVRFADSIVRKSQGAGTKMDQSSVERGFGGGSEFLKAMTLFYSYNNTVYNQLRASVRALNGVSDVPGFMVSYMLFAMIPGLMSTLLYSVLLGRFPDSDDKDFEKKMRNELIEIGVGDAFATIPILRDGWRLLMGERPRNASAIEIFKRELGDLVNVKDGRDLMFDATRSTALFMGWPGNRPLKEIEKLLEDE